MESDEIRLKLVEIIAPIATKVELKSEIVNICRQLEKYVVESETTKESNVTPKVMNKKKQPAKTTA